MEEAVASAWKEADGFIEQLGRTTQEPVRDVEGTLKKLGIRWNLSQNTQKAVEAALRREVPGQQETVYGLVNAFTNVAQTLADEARYDMEVLAGQLAQHGVAAYVPRRKDKTGNDEDAEIEALESEVSTPESNSHESNSSWSAVELAREMFEAEVVRRVPNSVPRSVPSSLKAVQR